MQSAAIVKSIPVRITQSSKKSCELLIGTGRKGDRKTQSRLACSTGTIQLLSKQQNSLLRKGAM